MFSLVSCLYIICDVNNLTVNGINLSKEHRLDLYQYLLGSYGRNRVRQSVFSALSGLRCQNGLKDQSEQQNRRKLICDNKTIILIFLLFSTFCKGIVNSQELCFRKEKICQRVNWCIIILPNPLIRRKSRC